MRTRHDCSDPRHTISRRVSGAHFPLHRTHSGSTPAPSACSGSALMRPRGPRDRRARPAPSDERCALRAQSVPLALQPPRAPRPPSPASACASWPSTPTSWSSRQAGRSGPAACATWPGGPGWPGLPAPPATTLCGGSRPRPASASRPGMSALNFPPSWPWSRPGAARPSSPGWPLGSQR